MVRKRCAWIVFGVCAVACLAVVIVVRASGGSTNGYPIWEKATEEERNPGARLEFKGIDFNTAEGYDTVTVSMENTTDQPMNHNPTYHVDYLADKEWITIYRPGVTQLYSAFLDGGATVSEKYYVSHNLFHQAGTYRLYIGRLGYCTIDILF